MDLKHDIHSRFIAFNDTTRFFLCIVRVGKAGCRILSGNNHDILSISSVLLIHLFTKTKWSSGYFLTLDIPDSSKVSLKAVVRSSSPASTWPKGHFEGFRVTLNRLVTRKQWNTLWLLLSDGGITPKISLSTTPGFFHTLSQELLLRRL